MNEERIAAPVSVQAEQPDTQGNQAASDAAGPSAASDQPSDTKRLDFVLEKQAFIVNRVMGADPNTYQLWVQDEDEEFHIISGEHDFFPTPRAAIDSAIAAQEKPQ